MNAIQSGAILLHSIVHAMNAPAVVEGLGLVQRVHQFARGVFQVGQAGCFFLIGAKEFCWDGIKNAVKASWYYLVHGSLFMASSTLGSLCLAHNYKLIHLGAGFTFVHLLGNVLFFGACCTSLYFHTKLFVQNIDIPVRATEQEKAKVKTEQTSALMGIINASCYIVATSAILLGGPALIGLFFGTIALSVGTVKFFYDLFYLPAS